MSPPKQLPTNRITAIWRAFAAYALLVGAVLVIYVPSLAAPFVFDDVPAILGNPTIRSLWPISDVLQPPADGAGVTGRPLVNLSLAINYAIGGTAVTAYRTTNILLHLACVLIGWRVVRRTMQTPFAVRWGDPWQLRAVAFATALVWAVHPLLTESVIFVVQRNEILAALFYLITFYCLLRGSESSAAQWWYAAGVLAAWAGMASKEIVATAPVALWLFDRTFIAGTFRRALAERRWFYLGLASSWGLLTALMISANQRAGTVGFGLGMSSLTYFLTQIHAVALYLKLSLWPAPLVLDYGTRTVHTLAEVWWQTILLVGLLAAATWGLGQRRASWGFAVVTFFLILAPSSSIVPLTTQTIAEHRMYLPLLAVLSVVVGAVGRCTRPTVFSLAVGVCVIACIIASVRRGQDYTDALTLWTDTVSKAPHNPRAHVNLARAKFASNDITGAEREYREALQLQPHYAEASYGIGLAAAEQGRYGEAIAYYRAALREAPAYTVVRNDLAAALLQTGQIDESLQELDLLLASSPNSIAALVNRGKVLGDLGRAEEAERSYTRALQLQPRSIEASLGLAAILLVQGRTSEALRRCEELLQHAPDHPHVQAALAKMLLAVHRPAEAIPLLTAATQRVEKSAAWEADLGLALMQTGNRAAALQHYRAAVALAPQAPDLRLNFALTLAANNQLAEAAEQCSEAIRLRPNFDAARRLLAELRTDIERSRR